MPYETYKNDLYHFEAPTIENDLHGGRTEKEIEGMIEFTNYANSAYAYVRRNGLPLGYDVDNLKKRNEAYGNAGPINFEEIYALDQAITRTYWDVNTFAKLPIPNVVMPKPRFELKEYLVQSNEWPRFTTTFRNPTFIHLKESSAFRNGIGIAMGISIPFTEIRESNGGLWGPEAEMRRELAVKMGLHASKRGFRGTDIVNQYGDDGSDGADYAITGLVNDANIQAFAAGADADADVTAQGDMEVSLRVALADLKNVKAPGKYIILGTSGLCSEMFLHRDTYQQKLDSERVKELLSIIRNLQLNNEWGGWYCTDQILAATPSTSNQVMVVAKVGPGLISRHVIYPLQTLTMANKLYEADVQEAMIMADIIQVKIQDTTNNAYPITVEDTITTSTTGFIPEGTRIL